MDVLAQVKVNNVRSSDEMPCDENNKKALA
jgi:hypothetical protein